MSEMADVLEDHRDLAWNHVTGQAICGDCDEPLGPFTAEIDEQNKWLRSHQAKALSTAGFGPVREARAGAIRQAAAVGWDAAVAAMKYEDGTPVDLAANVNPYRDNA